MSGARADAEPPPTRSVLPRVWGWQERRLGEEIPMLKPESPRANISQPRGLIIQVRALQEIQSIRQEAVPPSSLT